MNGDDRHPHDNPKYESDDDNLPASVIFTEMMRRAAGARTQEPPPPAQTAAPPVAETRKEAAPPPDMEARRHAAALEAQRIKRIERRKAERRVNRTSALGGLLRTLVIAGIAAALIATMLSWWIDPDALDPDLRASIGAANATPLVELVPTAVPTPNWAITIGIVSGHRGPENDPGAICRENGAVVLTENEVNFAVAQVVVQNLRELGYTVHLLDEFDPRLEDYRADVLVSLHSNDCGDYNGTFPSGYLVSQAQARPEGGEDSRLRECVAAHYERSSGLVRRYGLTRDMTDYHIFRAIHPATPGVILEMGFMLADQDLLVNNTGQLARGIADGVLCYLQTDEMIVPTPTPPPATAVPTG